MKLDKRVEDNPFVKIVSNNRIEYPPFKPVIMDMISERKNILAKYRGHYARKFIRDWFYLSEIEILENPRILLSNDKNWYINKRDNKYEITPNTITAERLWFMNHNRGYSCNTLLEAIEVLNNVVYRISYESIRE